MALENLKSTFTEGDGKVSALGGRHTNHENHANPVVKGKKESNYIDDIKNSTKANHSSLDFDTPLKEVRATQKESIYRLSKSVTGKNNLLSDMELNNPTPSGVNNQSSTITIEKVNSGTNNLNSDIQTIQKTIGDNNLSSDMQILKQRLGVNNLTSDMFPITSNAGQNHLYSPTAVNKAKSGNNNLNSDVDPIKSAVGGALGNNNLSSNINPIKSTLGGTQGLSTFCKPQRAGVKLSTNNNAISKASKNW